MEQRQGLEEIVRKKESEGDEEESEDSTRESQEKGTPSSASYQYSGFVI